MIKKIISIAVMFIMCVGLFGGCADMVNSYEWSENSFSYEFAENEERFSYEFLREIYNEVKLIMPYNSVFDVRICDYCNKVLISLTDRQDIEQITAHLRERDLYKTEAVLFGVPSNARNIPIRTFEFYLTWVILGLIFLTIIVIVIIKRRTKSCKK